MVDVLALLAGVSGLAGPSVPKLDPEHLPQLPARGLARETVVGVELQTMGGRPLGVVPRLNLAPDAATSRDLLLRDRRGSLYVLDRGARRLRRVSNGPPVRRPCRVTDRRAGVHLIVCKSTIKTRTATGTLRTVAKAPGKVGHWERAAFAPRGGAFFAQWSAECEVPIAFYVADRVMRPFGAKTMAGAPSSSALGWLPNGSAVVHFPDGACARRQGAPGIYAVPLHGRVTRLARTPGFEHYWMWGG